MSYFNIFGIQIFKIFPEGRPITNYEREER